MIHLRQICLVACNLKPVVADLNAILGLQVCHVDPKVGKWGLENALMPIGTDFLEVVAPTTQGTSAGRHLDRRGGDGGYMVICQAPSRDAQDKVRANAAENWVRVAYEADRETWRIMQLHPRDMHGTYLEVDWDQQADPTGNWMPAGGTDWKHAGADALARTLKGVEIQAERPEETARHWAKVCGLEASGTSLRPVLELANASITFTPITDGRGPGLSALDLKAEKPDRVRTVARDRNCLSPEGHVVICGTRINLA